MSRYIPGKRRLDQPYVTVGALANGPILTIALEPTGWQAINHQSSTHPL
jgi:hypothetical protein